MDFIVEIDYTNILENVNKIGSGKRGTAIKYKDNIIKIKNECSELIFFPKYSDSNKYELTNEDNKKIENARKLYNITTSLKYFSKVKGYVIFPNITGKYNCILESNIYENVGILTRGRKELDKNIFAQLIEILREFKLFNISGFFHEDVQACNNIELDDQLNLHVIDLDDVQIYKSNSIVKINQIIIDISKVVSCIESYILNETIIHTDNKIQIEIENKFINMILELFNCNQITFYNPSNSQKINFIEINGLIYDEIDKDYINRLQNIIINKIDVIKKKNINHKTYFDNLLLLMSNYKVNKSSIDNLIVELYEKGIYIREFSGIINIIYDKSLENIIINELGLKFEDIKKIIEQIYDEKIQKYNIILNNNYKNKYLKYKHKYIKLKNNNKL